MKLHNRLLHYPREIKKDSFYFFTANAFVKKDGGLVMGRGAAKEVLDQNPGIDQRFGRLISSMECKGLFPEYLLIWLNDYRIGAFQVKYDWQQPAYPDLIGQSAERLSWFAKAWPDLTIRMNYPGVGKGKLSFDDVQAILDLVDLPDNVHLYHQP